MTFYRRNLPHWFPDGKSVFITWHLHGCLSENVLQQLHSQKGLAPGGRFRRADRELDRTSQGPVWLREPQIAECVLRALRRGAAELEAYLLHAWVIMPNHVHLLIEPKVAMARITNGIKGYSSRLANQLLGRIGRPFWQDESFDHWVRNAEEFSRIRAYVEHNPVTAGLVERPEDWPWSSASRKIE